MRAHDIATLHGNISNSDAGSALKQSLVAIDGVTCLCKAPRNVVAVSRAGDNVELTNCDIGGNKEKGTRRREQGEGNKEKGKVNRTSFGRLPQRERRIMHTA
jgi:hypothetical protein